MAYPKPTISIGLPAEYTGANRVMDAKALVTVTAAASNCCEWACMARFQTSPHYRILRKRAGSECQTVRPDATTGEESTILKNAVKQAVSAEVQENCEDVRRDATKGEMRLAGLEPATYGLKVRCSTT